MDQKIPLLLAAAVLVFLFTMTHRKPKAVNDMVPVPTDFTQQWARDTQKEKETDGDIEVRHVASGDLAHFSLYNGDILQPKPQEAARLEDGRHQWEIKYYRHYYMFDPGLDLGAYCGVVDTRSSDRTDPIDAGLRVSPCRFLNGIVSTPDLLLSGRNAGFGISLFPPPELVGRGFSHLGIGVGHVWNYRTGVGENMAYLSFSVRYP